MSIAASPSKHAGSDSLVWLTSDILTSLSYIFDLVHSEIALASFLIGMAPCQLNISVYSEEVVLENNNGHLKQLAALCPPRPRASHKPLPEGTPPVTCRGAGPGGPA